MPLIREGLSRRAAGAVGASTAVLAASVLLVPGTATATPAAPVAPAPVPAEKRPAPGERGVALGNGERAELVDGAVRVTRDGRPSTGRYTVTSAGGGVTVQPAAGGAATVLRPARAKSARAASGPQTVKLVIPGARSANFFVWERTSLSFLEVDNSNPDARATLRLSPGKYFALAMNHTNGDGTYVLAKPFTVPKKAVTVTLDRKAARETGIRADTGSVARYQTSVGITGGGSMVNSVGGAEKVYVTPFSVPGVSLHLHDVLTRKGSSLNFPGPVRYDLTHTFRDTVPANPLVKAVTAKLGKSVTTVRAPGARTTGWLQSSPRLGNSMNGYAAAPVPVAGAFTQYATPGVSFARSFGYGYGPAPELPDRTLRAGANPGEILGAAPVQPVRDPERHSVRLGSRILLWEPGTHGDAAGNPARDDRARKTVRLSSGADLIAEATGDEAAAPITARVSDSRADYRLEHTAVRRVHESRLSTEVRNDWTFSSDWVGFEAELPLIDAPIKVGGLDAYNRAGTGPVTVSAAPATRGENPAPASTSRIEYSINDGADWVDMPLTRGAATLTVPAAASFVSLRVTAENTGGGTVRKTVKRAFAGPLPAGDEQIGATRISKAVVNNGRPIEVTGHEDFTARFTATDPSGIRAGGMYLYSGSHDNPAAVLDLGTAECSRTGATSAICESERGFGDFRDSLGRNSLAGTWRLAAWAEANDGTSLTSLRSAGAVRIRHNTEILVDAAPEPVVKGRTITVTGTLLRDDWERVINVPLAGRPVKLLFTRAGSTVHSTVKTVRTDAKGGLRTTVKAVADGTWRYSFAGDGTLAGTSASDYVDVR
ncbi:hypothetical protein [Streptomyces sp. CAU 1734]|uniref:hypothetical protein n=1 Tax=Streptomyces sp. CAU 1734 TaxID=3140360 RepID=UPI00326074AD